MYDYVQNSQGNSNQNDWATLHAATRNIRALTKVVAETNNEAHFNNEAAQEALKAAQEAVAVSSGHVASVGHSVAQAASHEASASRHADSVATAHSTVAGIVSTARDEVLFSVNEMLTLIQHEVVEASHYADTSREHVVSASRHKEAANTSRIEAGAYVVDCQRIKDSLLSTEDIVTLPQLITEIDTLEGADTDLSDRIARLEEAELPEMVAPAEFEDLKEVVRVQGEEQDLLPTEEVVDEKLGELQGTLTALVNAVDARLYTMAATIPSIEGLALQESVDTLKRTLNELGEEYPTLEVLNNSIANVNNTIAGIVRFDATQYHTKTDSDELLEDVRLALQAQIEYLRENGCGTGGVGGEGGVQDLIDTAIEEAKVISDEYTDDSVEIIRGEMETQKTDIVNEFIDRDATILRVVSNIDDRVKVLEGGDTGGGTGPDLTDLIADVEDNAEAITANTSKIAAVENKVNTNTANVAANTVTITTHTSDITANAIDIDRVEKSVTTLQGTVSTGFVDATTERRDMQLEINALKTALADAISRIVELEGLHLPPVANPTKWYVLPLGGQSNMVGYGETRVTDFFSHMNSRILQLPQPGRTAELTRDNTQYGDKLEEFRRETAQGLIPAAPCLDFNQNMFTHGRSGNAAEPIRGTVGAGLFIAELLLPHIPNDYGILIVPAGFGGTAFVGGDPNWDMDTGTLSHSFVSRVKEAMDINPTENKLLPFVWAQGESDAMVGSHEDYGNDWWKMYTLMKTTLEPYKDSFVWGWKWFIYSGIRAIFVATDEEAAGVIDHITHDITDAECQSATNRLSTTYSHFKFFNADKGEPDTFFPMRVELDTAGKYTQTNLEEGTGYTAGVWQHHFSTLGYKDVVAPAVANAILTYAKGDEPTYHSRKVHGGCGNVYTDYVAYVGDAMPALGEEVAGDTVDSFALVFDYKNKTELHAENFDCFTNVSGLQMRYEDGMISFMAGGHWLFVSPFYHAGAWDGGRNTVQEIGVVYKDATKEVLIYLNDNLVDSWRGVDAISLPASIGLSSGADGTPLGAAVISNMRVHALV